MQSTESAPREAPPVRWDRVAARYPHADLRKRTWLGAFLALGVTACLRHRADAATPAFIASFVVLAAVWWVSVFLHEVGHVIAARAMGFAPFLLTAGGGPRVFRRRAGDVVLDLGMFPGGGVVRIAAVPRKALRLRWVVVYAGGPVVTALLILLGSADSNALVDLANARPSGPISLGAALVVVNGFILLSTLLPSRSSDPTQPRNDIPQMISILFAPRGKLESTVRARATVEMVRRMVLRDFAAAADEARSLLDVDPTNWTARLVLSDLLLFAGAYEAAVEQYEALLAPGVLPERAVGVPSRAILANNLAWSLYVTGDPARLERADASSAEAHAALPTHPSIRGTRGAVLIELGRFEEGEALVESAFEAHETRFPRASNLACLSIAASRRGDRARATTLLEKARELDSDCEVLVRAERELHGASALAAGHSQSRASSTSTA